MISKEGDILDIMEYGSLHLRINEILEEKGISKNKLCNDLNIPRTNFNKYCRDEVTLLNTKFICKLCSYLDIEAGELIIYNKPLKNNTKNSDDVS